MQDTYFRRPVIHTDDIAALAPVMLGSGANLLGYYMFQGGRNPEGRLATLQESQRTGYPTDVPVKSYDFQAPLSEFGEERESFRRMKLVNYFLSDFGETLAPMQVAAPERLPSTPSDLSVARVAARTSGDHAFIFFNNYVRGASMPARSGFQIRLKLPSGELRIPDRPLELPSGAYGIWPVNFDLGGVRLIYSTAQLFKFAQMGGDRYYFFFAIPGLPAEFALARADGLSVDPSAATVAVRDGVRYVDVLNNAPSSAPLITLPTADGQVHIVLMQRQSAEEVWTVDGSKSLVRTGTQYFSDANRICLRSIGSPEFSFGVFGAGHPAAPAEVSGEKTDLFADYKAHVPAVNMSVTTKLRHDAGAGYAAPEISGVPLAPEDKDFDAAAEWDVKIPSQWSSDLSNVFLQVTYTGDVARLYAGHTLLDDNFWNGTPWRLGLRQWLDSVEEPGLELRILGGDGHRELGDAGEGKAGERKRARLVEATLLPEYETLIHLEP
jgi:beta-galactosidase